MKVWVNPSAAVNKYLDEVKVKKTSNTCSVIYKKFNNTRPIKFVMYILNVIKLYSVINNEIYIYIYI
jgi:hypothetical protein